MRSSRFAAATAFLLLALAPATRLNANSTVRFFAFGDLPYTAAQTEALRSLLPQVLVKGPPFLVHVGDVKSGSEPCTEQALGRVAELFRVQPVPVVFTPGDNEWTDCRRESAGGYDPAERLALLRRLYFGDPGVLRLGTLGISQPDADYPENYWFIHHGVFFVTVHVVGSDNNLLRGDAQAADEVTARSAANRRHLRTAVKAANVADASAFVLIFHANPGLQRPVPPRGFNWLRDDLTELLQSYSGPVLAIHGDTHGYRLDHPLLDPETGQPLNRFTRLEVPGSPIVAGVWINISPGAKSPFSVELAYPDSQNHLLE